MGASGTNLRSLSERNRRTHFHRDCFSHLATTSRVDLEQLLEQRNPFVLGSHAPRHERRLGCGDGCIGVGLTPQRDRGTNLLGRWVDDIKVVGFCRGYPLAVYIEIAAIDHRVLLGYVRAFRTLPLWSAHAQRVAFNRHVLVLDEERPCAELSASDSPQVQGFIEDPQRCSSFLR